MLNTTFSKTLNDAIGHTYVAPEDIARASFTSNQSFNTGEEHRLQEVYTDEIWMKLTKAGITPNRLKESTVLEICAGTGFLTYHLLSKSTPKYLAVNDISPNELESAKKLISEHFPENNINWVVGDIHTLNFNQKFDIIIGNSFIHHFYNVPEVLSRLLSLLNEGGVFISIHEPTPMSVVVESRQTIAYPMALISPTLVCNIARQRYQGAPSETDLWLFEPSELHEMILKIGFKSTKLIPYHLLRPIIVQRKGLHLSASKPRLTNNESDSLSKAIKIDNVLNNFLPYRFFGSICICCYK